MKIFWRIVADLLFVTHGVVIVILIAGWLFPTFFMLHGLLLVLTLLSWLSTGACVLAVWEFKARQRAQPELAYKPEYAYMHHYLSYIFKRPPSVAFMHAWGLVFLTGSLTLWILNVFINYT